jgi:hypothetical protein
MSEQRKKVSRFMRSFVYGGIFFMVTYITSLPIFSRNFSNQAPVIPSALADIPSDSYTPPSDGDSGSCDGSSDAPSDCSDSPE